MDPCIGDEIDVHLRSPERLFECLVVQGRDCLVVDLESLIPVSDSTVFLEPQTCLFEVIQITISVSGFQIIPSLICSLRRDFGVVNQAF